MILEFLHQLASELVCALLIDEVSERVRGRIVRALYQRRQLRRQRFYLHLARRHSRELLHRLRTVPDELVQ
jgi:hypothetical protein